MMHTITSRSMLISTFFAFLQQQNIGILYVAQYHTLSNKTTYKAL